MHTHNLVLRCQAERAPQFVDITEQVRLAVAESTIQDGLVTVFTREPRAAITINEHEPLLLEDLERLLNQLDDTSPAGRRSEAAVAEAPALIGNRSRGFLGASETIPLVEGRLAFGRWQSLFLIELERPGTREIVVQVVGV